MRKGRRGISVVDWITTAWMQGVGQRMDDKLLLRLLNSVRPVLSGCRDAQTSGQ